MGKGKTRTIEELKSAIRDYLTNCHQQSASVASFTYEEIQKSLKLNETEQENFGESLEDLEEDGLIVSK